MILDEEEWRRHLAEGRRRDDEIARLRRDLEDMDAEVDRALTRLQQIEERLSPGSARKPPAV